MTSEEGIDDLSVEDLAEIASGVIGPFQIRDAGLLASAAARPTTTVFGHDAYQTFPEKVAALMHSLARNHALIDGNKRLAWSAARAFCLMNGRDLRYANVDAAEAFALDVAAGVIDVPDIAHWIAARLVEM